ncbi:MAG: glycosyl hydrolase [bacterium]
MWKNAMFAILFLGLCGLGSVPWATAGALAPGLTFLPREEYNMPLEAKGKIITGAGQGSMESFLQYTKQVDPCRYPGLYMDYASLMQLEKLEKRVKGWNTLKPGTIIQLGLSMTQDGKPELHFEHKVAKGEMDVQLNELVRVLKGTKHPILVRIGYEFNGKWNGYEPEPYRKAFRRVAERLRAGLGKQVAFAWCFSLDDNKNNDFMSYFPGDDVVDWWSVDVFGEDHYTHKELKPFLEAAHQHRRPVLIGESTPRKVSVQLGEDSVRRWFKPYFTLLAENPGIKAFSYIYWDWSKTRWSTWGDGRFGENPAVKAYFNSQLQNPIFAPVP